MFSGYTNHRSNPTLWVSNKLSTLEKGIKLHHVSFVYTLSQLETIIYRINIHGHLGFWRGEAPETARSSVLHIHSTPRTTRVPPSPASSMLRPPKHLPVSAAWDGPSAPATRDVGEVPTLNAYIKKLWNIAMLFIGELTNLRLGHFQ